MNVVDFTGKTTLAISVDRVLDAAKENLDCGAVVGIDSDGELYVASSLAGIDSTVALLERAKLQLLRKFEDDY